MFHDPNQFDSGGEAAAIGKKKARSTSWWSRLFSSRRKRRRSFFDEELEPAVTKLVSESQRKYSQGLTEFENAMLDFGDPTPYLPMLLERAEAAIVENEANNSRIEENLDAELRKLSAWAQEIVAPAKPAKIPGVGEAMRAAIRGSEA